MFLQIQNRNNTHSLTALRKKTAKVPERYNFQKTKARSSKKQNDVKLEKHKLV